MDSEYIMGACEYLPCCGVKEEAGGDRAHRPTLPSCGTARELHIPNTGQTNQDKGTRMKAFGYRQCIYTHSGDAR